MGNRSRSRVHCDVILLWKPRGRRITIKRSHHAVLFVGLWGGYYVHAHCRQLHDVHSSSARFLCHIPRLLDWKCDHVLCSSVENFLERMQTVTTQEELQVVVFHLQLTARRKGEIEGSNLPGRGFNMSIFWYDESLYAMRIVHYVAVCSMIQTAYSKFT